MIFKYRMKDNAKITPKRLKNRDYPTVLKTCDVCGRKMDEKGIDFDLSNLKIAERKHIIEIFGRDKFYVCFVCWLKSLGVSKAPP